MTKYKADLVRQLEEELNKDEFSIDEQKIRRILLELDDHDSPVNQNKRKEALDKIAHNLLTEIGRKQGSNSRQ